ncbi:hypothetical protein GCM10009627_19490 [Curtobacterium herbarum]|uniref:Uncharacterized protein n=1 Tax=Curtobacterium herbarum TaxID=150122 RepID=A0ABN1ZDF3_9MICO
MHGVGGHDGGLLVHDEDQGSTERDHREGLVTGVEDESAHGFPSDVPGRLPGGTGTGPVGVERVITATGSPSRGSAGPLRRGGEVRKHEEHHPSGQCSGQSRACRGMQAVVVRMWTCARRPMVRVVRDVDMWAPVRVESNRCVQANPETGPAREVRGRF